MCTIGVLTNTHAVLYNAGLPKCLWAEGDVWYAYVQQNADGSTQRTDAARAYEVLLWR